MRLVRLSLVRVEVGGGSRSFIGVRSFHASGVRHAESCGIVGLPNVGKSCLFNALLAQPLAKSANFPFCTITPTSGKAEVPDERLKILASIVKPEKIVPAKVQFVDIAGLVEGASDGAGLGNQFLDHVRGASAIIHLVRCFDLKNSPVVHVMSTVDPVRDAMLIESELIAKDMQLLEGFRKGKLPPNLPFDSKLYVRLAQRAHEGMK